MAIPVFRHVVPALCLALMFHSAVLQAGWREALPDAQLVGEGELRIFGFAIYHAELWSPHPEPRHALDMAQPFALQLTYRRSVSRDDLVEASLKEIRRLANPTPAPALIQRWEQQMRAAFVDVNKGDRITGVFMPGEGVRFYVGEALQHEVDDPAFAQAFFAIWLDRRTRNPALRTQLLGASGS